MVRRIKCEAQERAAAELEAMVQRKAPPKKRALGPTTARVQNMMATAKLHFKAGEWGAATSHDVVALYALFHEHVYGVVPTELVGKEWMGAASQAKRFIREHFGESIPAVVEYMRWLWTREKEREQWRRDNGKEGGRISWRMQFSANGNLTEYRVNKLRAKS